MDKGNLFRRYAAGDQFGANVITYGELTGVFGTGALGCGQIAEYKLRQALLLPQALPSSARMARRTPRSRH